MLQSALAKARWRLIPLLAVCYLVAYMDRTNISFAAEPMGNALHFTQRVYGLGAGLFFVSYALCEIPSNRLLLRFGARRWLARIMLTWGLIAMAMVLTRSPRSYYGLRLALGAAEAGYFPGAVYFLSRWFPGKQRARALSFFYLGFPLSTALMGSLAGSLLRLNGRLGLAGWQWIFLVEAVPAVFLSAAVWFGLPDRPAVANWLTAPEREALEAEVARENAAAQGSHGGNLGLVLRSGRTWAIAWFYFCGLGTSYALAFSLPVVLGRSLGWDAARVGYLLAVAGIAGAGGDAGQRVALGPQREARAVHRGMRNADGGGRGGGRHASCRLAGRGGRAADAAELLRHAGAAAGCALVDPARRGLGHRDRLRQHVWHRGRLCGAVLDGMDARGQRRLVL